MTTLQQHIDQTGFAAASATILAHAQPCHHILADGDARDAPLGHTRLGGTPDLPAGTPWPCDDQGQLGNFFGQFDLADLALRAHAASVPRTGLLSLFMTAYESAGSPVTVKAVWTPPSTPLKRHAAPASEDDLADPDTGLLDPIRIRFEPGHSLPFHDSTFNEAIEAAAPQAELHLLQSAVERSDDDALVGQWLGYAAPGDRTDFYRMLHLHRIGRGDLQYLAYWRTWADYEAAEARYAGMPGHRKRSARDRAGIRWICDHDAEITAAAAQWQMLLRIDSNHPMRFNMNDWDPIYFMIASADLARGDFSRVEAGVTQG